MIAVDTNLLIYAHRAATPEHRAACAAVERAAADRRGWGVALPCLAEFWGIVTHPSLTGGPSTAARAAAFLRALIDGGAVWYEPRPGLASRLELLAERMDVCGARIFDLQIALIATEAGATELWTHDRGFVTIPGLRRHDPLR